MFNAIKLDTTIDYSILKADVDGSLDMHSLGIISAYIETFMLNNDLTIRIFAPDELQTWGDHKRLPYTRTRLDDGEIYITWGYLLANADLTEVYGVTAFLPTSNIQEPPPVTVARMDIEDPKILKALFLSSRNNVILTGQQTFQKLLAEINRQYITRSREQPNSILRLTIDTDRLLGELGLDNWNIQQIAGFMDFSKQLGFEIDTSEGGFVFTVQPSQNLPQQYFDYQFH